MSRTEIGAVCPHLRVVHLSEAKAIGKIAILRPKRAFRPRSGQKFARVSAQYNASPAHLFAYFFWRNRKSRPSETQLRCHRTHGSFGETGQEGRCGHRPLQTAVQNRLRSNSCGVTAKEAPPVPAGNVGPTESSAPANCCAELSAERQLRSYRKRDSSGETRKRTRSGDAGAERTRHGDT